MNRVQQLIEAVVQGAAPAQVLEAPRKLLTGKGLADLLTADLEAIDSNIGATIVQILDKDITTVDTSKDSAIHDLLVKMWEALENVDRLLAALRRV